MSAKPLILKDKLKEVVAQQIMDAAEAEWAEQGVAATSMTAIAQRAGVSVGTLYNYFKDKEVLLATMLSTRRADFAQQFADALQKHQDEPFESCLRSMIESVFDTFENQRNFLRIVLGNEKPKEHSSSKPTSLKHFIDRWKVITDRGVAEGLLSPEDADLYPSALASLIRGVMIQRLDDTKRPFRDATQFVLRVFLNGART